VKDLASRPQDDKTLIPGFATASIKMRGTTNQADIFGQAGGAAMEKRSRLLVLMGVLVLALFSYPLLSIVNRDLCYGGIPLLIYYFFGVWLLAIVMLYWGRRFLSS
jgi:hypothetical protein